MRPVPVEIAVTTLRGEPALAIVVIANDGNVYAFDPKDQTWVQLPLLPETKR